MTYKFLYRYLIACTFICSSSVTFAQVIPSDIASQELLRYQERERVLQDQWGKVPDVRLQQEATEKVDRVFPKDETPCFTISQVSLVGESAEKFQFALKSLIGGEDPAIGRCIGVQGINLALARVQNAIIHKGYITTRVIIAPQNLNSGNLELRIIPGRVHSIFLKDNDLTHAKLPATSAEAQKIKIPKSQQAVWNALPISVGEILNLRDIEQGLENLQRPPTAEADIQITPAKSQDASAGESDLMISYKQKFPLRMSVFIDNGGSNTTGTYQGGVTLSYDNPLKLNDLLYVSLSNDLDDVVMSSPDAGGYGTNGYTVYYAVPYKYWLADITASAYHYEQTVAGTNQDFSYSGDSDTLEVNLTRLIYRDAKRKTSILFGGYLNNSKNFIEDTEIETQQRRMAGWNAEIAHREFIGNATLDLIGAYQWGTGAFGAMPAPEEAFGEGTAKPHIFTADAILNIPFALGGQSFKYNTIWRSQWTADELIPQDRFAIGGRYTVRGFDGENVLSAENGWLVRNDLGLMLGRSQQELYAGFDYGQVGGPSADLLLGTELAGAVVGFRGQYKMFSYDIFSGWPVLKPEGFVTSSTTVAFTLSCSF